MNILNEMNSRSILTDNYEEMSEMFCDYDDHHI